MICYQNRSDESSCSLLQWVLNEVLNSIIYTMLSNVPSLIQPSEYPPYKTCHQYFQAGTLVSVLQKMVVRLNAHRNSYSCTLQPAFTHESCALNKRCLWVVETKFDRGSHTMAINKEGGRSQSVRVFSANFFETTLVQRSFKRRVSNG